MEGFYTQEVFGIMGESGINEVIDMACEKPVLSTELPGVKAIASDKVMYVANHKRYKEKIEFLFNDEELRREMGKSGREFVVENHDWERIVKKLEYLLGKVKYENTLCAK